MPSAQIRPLIFTLTILILHVDLNAQKKDVHETPIPKNIERCFTTLDKTMPNNEIELITRNYFGKKASLEEKQKEILRKIKKKLGEEKFVSA